MQSFKFKLIAAGASLVVAAVLLVTASFAWFTISTNPEIAGIKVGIKADRTLLLSLDTEELDFKQHIDLSEDFKYLTPLHPVSTVNGLDWYIPTYNEQSGALNDPDDFIHDDTLEYANVTTLDLGTNEIHRPDVLPSVPKELTGYELQEREGLGYYVYTDFWLMTEDDNGCRVRLSVPHYPSRDQLEKEEIDQGSYGSYVLQTCALTTDDSGSTVALLSRNAETSMRVGFLLNPDDDTANMIAELNTEAADEAEDGDEVPVLDTAAYNSERNKFFIYEPNADQRSAVNKPIGGEKENEDNQSGNKVDYIKGYKFNSENYTEGKYFVTRPIAPKSKTRTNTETGETETYAGAEPDSIPTDCLLIQKASSWDLAKVQAKLSENKQLDSNDVNYPMGGFLNAASVYGALLDDANDGKGINNAARIADVSSMTTDIAGSSVIVTLKENTPIKVRLFIWIEGQDVDCWNDIAAGSFIVNLELAGETIPDQPAASGSGG